jgi:hypothetical protein
MDVLQDHRLATRGRRSRTKTSARHGWRLGGGHVAVAHCLRREDDVHGPRVASVWDEQSSKVSKIFVARWGEC